jgi:hypothetical protein
MLGRAGIPEARAEVERLILERLASDRRLSGAMINGTDPTVNERVARLWQLHGVEHFRRPDGSPTTEVAESKRAFRPLRRNQATIQRHPQC